ncbi:MAG: YfhO family protein [Oscillospiraceae bacterium]|nr:YfhO family protein [Oscillospiraceae bacterium]
MNQNRIRRAGISLLSCVIVFAMFLIFNACCGIFPCGGNTIVWCDMEQQAVPLLLQLKQQLCGGMGGDICYSVLDGGGMQFYGVFFFFLSNPLSFLVLLTDLPADRLVVLLVMLKLALSAGTAAVWLQTRVQRLPASLTVLLAVMYGCSGYGLFYYQNLMWLDIMAMTPLLLCSIRHLLKKQRALPYCAVLSAMMILCFYLGYMVVLFVLLYTALSVRFTVPEAKRRQTALHFWGANLFACCLTAFVWLPCLIQVLHSGRSGKLLEDLMHPMLFHHLGDKICVLGATCLGFAALPLLWQTAGQVSLRMQRDRRLFLLLAAAVVLDPINKIWHGGSYQAFPLRWGMFPILLMLTLAAEQLSEDACVSSAGRIIRTRNRLFPLIGILLTGAAAFLIRKFAEPSLHEYTQTLWIGTKQALWMLLWFFIVTSVYACVIISRQQRTLSVRGCSAMLAVLFAMEFSISYHCYFGGAATEDTLYAQTVSVQNAGQPEDPDARLRLTRKYAHANMLGALGYPTTAHYTSLTRADYLHGMKRFGYSSYWMEVPSTGGTVLSDALWHVRYLLGSYMDLPPWTERKWTDNGFVFGESSMTLPAAFLTDADPAEIAELPEGSRMSVQARLAETCLGLRDVTVPYAPSGQSALTLTADDAGGAECTLDPAAKSGEICYSLFVPERQALYFDLYSQTGTALSNPRNGACDIHVNGRLIEADYPQNNKNGLIYLGTYAGEYVKVQITVHKDFACESFGVFGLLLDPLEDALQKVKGAAVQYQHGARIRIAECDADRAQTLIFSTAYDEGFSAEVNGEPAEVFRVNSCQTAVRVPAGHSIVRLQFHVQGLRTGVLLGIAGLTGAVILFLLRRRIPERMQQCAGNAAWGLLRLSYVLILVLVYALPLIAGVVGLIFV